VRLNRPDPEDTLSVAPSLSTDRGDFVGTLARLLAEDDRVIQECPDRKDAEVSREG
jgi:hypothetical protein